MHAIEHYLAAVTGDVEVFDDEVATRVREPPLGPSFEIDEPEILVLDLSAQHDERASSGHKRDGLSGPRDRRAADDPGVGSCPQLRGRSSCELRSKRMAQPPRSGFHLRDVGNDDVLRIRRSRCQPIVRHAGEGYLEVGEHPHIARNETSAPATNVVTYLVPPGAALRVDEPFPGNCPF
jgi:hypothetical protein